MSLKTLSLSLILASIFLSLFWTTLVWMNGPANAGKADFEQISVSGRDNSPGQQVTPTHRLSISRSLFFVKPAPYEKLSQTEVVSQSVNQALSSAYPNNSYDSGAAFLPPYLSDSDRMGYGKASNHDASILNAGWYVDWAARANPPHPGGAEYARTIVLNVHDTGTKCGWAPQPATQHLQVTPTLTGTALIQNVQANPGALWIIGNEMDTINNHTPIQPELYAELYHDLYTIIKNADPTAKVAIGAIVQPSPLRLAYLDRVLNYYENAYGQSFPVDVWNIHFYLFNEVECEWGAGEPPFVPGPGWEIPFLSGTMFDLARFESNLRAFRQWMYDRGYGDKPLIITEYGVLPPPEFGFPDTFAAQFLRDMSTLFLTSTDPVIGYAPDGNRLVQKWAWFSTNFAAFGGDLFDTNGNLTAIGQAFIQERNAHFSPYVDLQPIPPLSVLTTTDSLSLTAFIQNKGNSSDPLPAVHIALLDATSGLTATHFLLNLPPLQRRYAQPPTLIDHTWHVSFTTQPSTTVPYTLSIAVATADANPANDRLAIPVNWWPLADLAVSSLTFSPDPVLVTNQAVPVVITATVTNVGLLPTSQTPLSIGIQPPDGQTAQFLTNALVPPLQPAQSRLFTTTLLISQPGSFTLFAFLPDPLGPPEITNNNRLEVSLSPLSPTLFLPLLAK